MRKNLEQQETTTKSNANKQQITTSNKKTKPKQTTKTNKNQPSEKTTQQYKGYWAKLAIKQKKEKEEKETTSQVKKTTQSSVQNNKQRLSLEEIPISENFNFEASPDHNSAHYDVPRGKILEHSFSLESNKIRLPVIEKGKQITEKLPT